MFLMSPSDFDFPRVFTGRVPPVRVFGFANCPGKAPVRSTKLAIRGLLTPLTAPVSPKIFPQNPPNPPNYFLCEEYNKWEVVV